MASSPKSRSAIYASYSPKERRLIVLTSALIAALTPFTDTIYLPALAAIALDLDASQTQSSLSVSIYLAAVGIGQLVWGPLSDRFGRLPLLLTCLAIYEGLTIACVFATSIEVLIVERSLQGLVVGVTIISSSTIIADVFHPRERGAAMGSVIGPMLLGPVIAPLVGGFLCQAFSWRSTFMFLAVLNVLCVGSIVAFFTETHHWYSSRGSGKSTAGVENTGMDMGESVKDQALPSVEPDEESSDGTKVTTATTDAAPSKVAELDKKASSDPVVEGMEDSDAVEAPVHMVESLHQTGQLLVNPQLFITFFMASITFGTMFTSLTVLSFYLATPPYSLSQDIIGLCFLPVGVAMMGGAVGGGALSDYSGLYFGSSVPEGRLILPLLASFPLTVSAVGYGLCLYYGTSLAGVLITHAMVGFFQALLMPGISAYLTEREPRRAGAVTAIFFLYSFGGAAVFVSFSLIISAAIGVQVFFAILAAACCVTLGVDLLYCAHQVVTAKKRKANTLESSSSGVTIQEVPADLNGQF